MLLEPALQRHLTHPTCPVPAKHLEQSDEAGRRNKRPAQFRDRRGKALTHAALPKVLLIASKDTLGTELRLVVPSQHINLETSTFSLRVDLNQGAGKKVWLKCKLTVL